MTKPIVIDRPWWRHPIFPWGWRSLRKDVRPQDGQTIELSGRYAPGDGGGGVFTYLEPYGPAGLKLLEDLDEGIVIGAVDSVDGGERGIGDV